MIQMPLCQIFPHLLLLCCIYLFIFMNLHKSATPRDQFHPVSRVLPWKQ